MRLIDADKIMEDIAITERSTSKDYTLLTIARYIRLQPTIDAEPVRHGKWIKQKNEDTDDSTIYGWECSVCGEGVVWRSEDDINLEKFCYNCGAKMSEMLMGDYIREQIDRDHFGVIVIPKGRIYKVINLIKHLLEEGENNIEIYMHDFYAIVIADGAVEKRHHIYFDDGETT